MYICTVAEDQQSQLQPAVVVYGLPVGSPIRPILSVQCALEPESELSGHTRFDVLTHDDDDEKSLSNGMLPPRPSKTGASYWAARRCARSLLKREKGPGSRTGIASGLGSSLALMGELTGRRVGPREMWLALASASMPRGSAASPSQATGRPRTFGQKRLSHTTVVDTQPTAELGPLSQSSCPRTSGPCSAPIRLRYSSGLFLFLRPPLSFKPSFWSWPSAS